MQTILMFSLNEVPRGVERLWVCGPISARLVSRSHFSAHIEIHIIFIPGYCRHFARHDINHT